MTACFEQLNLPLISHPQMQPLLGEKASQRGGATSHLPPEHVFDQRAERLPRHRCAAIQPSEMSAAGACDTLKFPIGHASVASNDEALYPCVTRRAHGHPTWRFTHRLPQ